LARGAANLDDREIVRRIRPHHGSPPFALIGQGYFQLLGIRDDMVIGNDISVVIDNRSGSGGAFPNTGSKKKSYSTTRLVIFTTPELTSWYTRILMLSSGVRAG